MHSVDKTMAGESFPKLRVPRSRSNQRKMKAQWNVREQFTLCFLLGPLLSIDQTTSAMMGVVERGHGFRNAAPAISVAPTGTAQSASVRRCHGLSENLLLLCR